MNNLPNLAKLRKMRDTMQSDVVNAERVKNNLKRHRLDGGPSYVGTQRGRKRRVDDDADILDVVRWGHTLPLIDSDTKVITDFTPPTSIEIHRFKDAVKLFEIDQNLISDEDGIRAALAMAKESGKEDGRSCILTTHNGLIVSGGYAQTPSDDCKEETHAFLTALSNMQWRERITGGRAYMTHFPCKTCLVQMGYLFLSELYYIHGEPDKELLKELHIEAKKITTPVELDPTKSLIKIQLTKIIPKTARINGVYKQ